MMTVLQNDKKKLQLKIFNMRSTFFLFVFFVYETESHTGLEQHDVHDDAKILFLEKPLDVSWNLFLSVNSVNVVPIVSE